MKLGPYELNTIITGDARELAKAIPHESVDLIVTDPPYNLGKNYGDGIDDSLPEAEYLQWYEWICYESYRVMTGGYLYVSCSVAQLWILRPLWEQAGFSFQVLLMWHGPNYATKPRNIKSQWSLLCEPIMMFLKGPRQPMLNGARGCSTNAILRYPRPQRNFSGDLKRIHPCQKPTLLYRNIISRTPGDIVLDWFVGSGATGKAAKQLGRTFIGFELNPDTANLARERVANAQPPLFVPQAEEQARLNLQEDKR